VARDRIVPARRNDAPLRFFAWVFTVHKQDAESANSKPIKQNAAISVVYAAP